MPTGNLPDSAKKIYERVYQELLSGKCKGDKECAAKQAWGAVHNAGWKKDEKGEWHKKADLTEFSLTITKASYDKASGEMRWSAVASDTEKDSYDEAMSLELFSDFVKRIESKEVPPPEFTSSAWSGGLPYVSLSHYPDLNGKGIVGDVAKVYVDGNRLKANGTFRDNELGRACFRSVCDDLYNKKNDVATAQSPVRISIAFLDWAHSHAGMRFERKSYADRCPLCKQGAGEKVYNKGHLIHLALTRVPVNRRTEIEPDMEVTRSMTTQLEDAASIAGEQIAEELEKEDKAMIGKSEFLVVKGEDEATAEIKESAQPEVAVVAVEQKSESTAILEALGRIEKMIGEKWIIPEVKVISGPDEEDAKYPYGTEDETEEKMCDDKDKKKKKEMMKSHALDTQITALKSAFDEQVEKSATQEEKLAALNTPLTELVQAIRSQVVKPEETPVVVNTATVSKSEIAAAISDAMRPLAEQIGLINAQLSAKSGVGASQATPPRRSIVPSLVQQSEAKKPKPGSIEEIAWKSTGY